MSDIIPAKEGSTPAAVKKACCTPQAEEKQASRPAEISPVRSLADPTQHMIQLPGGSFLMGTDYEEAFPDDGEGPVREVTLSPFWIDRYSVTNQRFKEFIDETKYVTEAERFGWSFVFWAHIPKERFHDLVEDTVAAAPWWCKVSGANWMSPEGPGSHIDSRGEHPVVHVSWHDAAQFCEWSGTRLPTEAEWEYAARGGLVQKLYPWGDKLRPDGKHMCNIWQGEFPYNDTGEDGFTGTCPVDAFPPNGFGLYSTTGNAWEWCADWFSTTFHATAGRTDPQGPPSGEARVMKGGSFLCHKSYCNRYRVAARSSSTPDSSTSHMSFRCARNM
jgi:formylglycine-generating enzyme required for sulfatase activity